MSHGRGWNKETGCRRLHNTILDGNICAAVWQIMDGKGAGSIYGLCNECTKTGHPILEIIREYHLFESNISVKENFNKYDGVNIPELLKPMPLFVFKENVLTAATRLCRGFGPYSITCRQLKEWLLRHIVTLEKLCKEMALWDNHFVNSSL